MRGVHVARVHKEFVFLQLTDSTTRDRPL